MKTHPDALALANELMNARDIESINICQHIVTERLALIAERDAAVAREAVLRERGLALDETLSQWARTEATVANSELWEHVCRDAMLFKNALGVDGADPDRAAAERDARLVSEVREAAGKQLVSICSTYGVVVEIQSGLVVVRSADPLRETKAKARDDALQEAVRELERQAQGWRNARTSSDHAEETAEGYDAAAVVVQALLGKAGTT